MFGCPCLRGCCNCHCVPSFVVLDSAGVAAWCAAGRRGGCGARCVGVRAFQRLGASDYRQGYARVCNIQWCDTRILHAHDGLADSTGVQLKYGTCGASFLFFDLRLRSSSLVPPCSLSDCSGCEPSNPFSLCVCTTTVVGFALSRDAGGMGRGGGEVLFSSSFPRRLLAWEYAPAWPHPRLFAGY